VGARADLLTAQIEEAKGDLARSLAEFRVGLDDLRRKVMIGAAVAAAVSVAALLLTRRRRRRHRR
jgi:hypothetical protein